MSEIRVRLRWSGGVRLEYRGRREGFESVLGPLLDGLAEPSARPSPAPIGRGHALPRARGPEGAAEEPAEKRAEKRAEEPAGYEPPSDRFGTFQRQLAVEEEHAEHLVAAYAFFLWNYEKREVFSEDEVAGCFAADGRTLPTDPAEVYGDLLTQRVLSPGAGEHTWRLTSKGRDFVRHHLLSA